MNKGLPITLTHLDGKLCVVVGGGEVAERKVRALLEAGAKVRLIAPRVTAGLSTRAQSGEIEWWPREYCAGDLADAFLVIATTDDAGTNAAIARDATAPGCLLNVVDDPTLCNFIAPAVVRRGDLTIAISTGGDVPALAAYLRAHLEAQFGDEWGAYVAFLARLRPQIAARYPDLDARRAAWARVLASDLRTYIGTRDASEIVARVEELLADRK
ncbi:MAG: bifunctional precorrin-2 dehydrogenase/sirohydrochlorin ferrochelatase [Chloroflexi bacterium]|nr:bifunctional precorrin-2 dehydrogenase/sirohydrochlorin ferrochelatase [Chloroflexota bacterium]